MNDPTTILVCLTTVASRDDARKLGQDLLKQNLAACVQIDAEIESHYRWEERDCCETEYRLVIKTAAANRDSLMQHLRRVHPYDQPQILFIPTVASDPGFAEWVAKCVHR